jgi:hypothetical protein
LDAADGALLHQVAHLLPGGAGIALVADLHDALEFKGLRIKLFGQAELGPVPHRLFTVHILARPDRVERLRDVEAVGRGDADDIHIRVGQQFHVLHVSLGAGRLGGFVQPIAVGVANRHNFELLAGLNQALHGAYMAGTAPANADEADAELVVSAQDAAARHIGRGLQEAQRGGGFGGRMDEFTAAQGAEGCRCRLGFHNQSLPLVWVAGLNWQKTACF